MLYYCSVFLANYSFQQEAGSSSKKYYAHHKKADKHCKLTWNCYDLAVVVRTQNADTKDKEKV